MPLTESSLQLEFGTNLFQRNYHYGGTRRKKFGNGESLLRAMTNMEPFRFTQRFDTLVF